MNTPNKLTLLRIVLIPIFLFLFYMEWVPWHYLWALLVFALASVTDLLDGKIARKYHLITDFGKFMDPLADKLLVVSAIICLMEQKWVGAIVVIIIVSREFLVTSLRLVAAPKGIVIAADKWGKYKTALQMVWICTALLFLWITQNLNLLAVDWVFLVNEILVVCVTVLTVISGVNYVWKNRSLLKDM